jgi:hypothetical protein
MSERKTCPVIEKAPAKAVNYVMTRRKLEGLVQRIGQDIVERSGGSGFTNNNVDPVCLINPMIDAFQDEMKEANIEFSLEEGKMVENSNPNDFAVESETRRYRYAFKFPHVTPGGKVLDSIITFNITTYWYENINRGRNEITTTVDVMALETYNKA